MPCHKNPSFCASTTWKNDDENFKFKFPAKVEVFRKNGCHHTESPCQELSNETHFDYVFSLFAKMALES